MLVKQADCVQLEQDTTQACHVPSFVFRMGTEQDLLVWIHWERGCVSCVTNLVRQPVLRFPAWFCTLGGLARPDQHPARHLNFWRGNSETSKVCSSFALTLIFSPASGGGQDCLCALGRRSLPFPQTGLHSAFHSWGLSLLPPDEHARKSQISLYPWQEWTKCTKIVCG